MNYQHRNPDRQRQERFPERDFEAPRQQSRYGREPFRFDEGYGPDTRRPSGLSEYGPEGGYARGPQQRFGGEDENWRTPGYSEGPGSYREGNDQGWRPASLEYPGSSGMPGEEEVGSYYGSSRTPYGSEHRSGGYSRERETPSRSENEFESRGLYGSEPGRYGSEDPGHYSGGFRGRRGVSGPQEEDFGRWTYRRGQAGNRGKGPKGYTRSDDRIREDISEKMTDDGYLDASDIEVKVDNGEVTLSGNVSERNEKRLAEDLADCCSGVKHVQNNLRIGKGERSSESSFETSETQTKQEKSGGNSQSKASGTST